MLSPLSLTKLILLHTIVVIQYSHHIKMACLVKRGQNAQKQIYYKQIIQKDPWALDRSPESLSRGEDVYHKIILLPSADSFKKGCCQLQAKACARITG